MLAAMLQDSSAIQRAIADGVASEHFHVPHHRVSFEVMLELYREGAEADVIAVASRASLTGRLESMGGEDVLSLLASAPTDALKWLDHTNTLREAHGRRVAVSEAQGIINQAGTTNVTDLATLARQLTDKLSSAVAKKSAIISPKDSARAFMANFIAAYENGEMPGQSTGVYEIDEATGGMRSGELWVVCAETSGGKSALCMQIAGHLLKGGMNVLIVTLELTAPEIVGRLVSVIGKVRYTSVVRPRECRGYDKQIIDRISREMAESGPFIIDEGGLSIDRICTLAKQLAEIEKISLIIVDYIQLVDGGRQRGESRQQEVSKVSRALKQLAKSLACPVLAPSQLNDDGKLFEARSIGHDADTIFTIRDGKITVDKARNSKRGVELPLVLNGEFQRFERHH